MTQSKISDSAVRRLSLYLRLLREFRAREVDLVSSRDLAARAGATAAQVRKDLSLFGSFGKRGRGYAVAELIEVIEGILGLRGHWRVVLVGVGKIGTALLGFRDLERRGFEIVAAVDTDERVIGTEVFGVRVSPLAELGRLIREREAEIGIVATPPEAAQEVATKLAAAGVRGILSFAPVKLSVPKEICVRNVDVVLELEGLSYRMAAGWREGTRDRGEGARDRA